jgi:hypothetical protein
MGETSPDPARGDHGPHNGAAQLEMALGGSMAGTRLKDLRSVIAWVRSRQDVDGVRVAVWGDSFAPANAASPMVDEIEFQTGPELRHQAEPGGPLLAMLAGLYDGRIRAVAALGGLAEFTSVLAAPFTYVPMDALIPGVLETADIPDIAAALAPRSLLVAGCVDGRNVPVVPAGLGSAFGRVKKAYADAGHAGELRLAGTSPATADWLLAALRK